jgi:hypothetical protein
MTVLREPPTVDELAAIKDGSRVTAYFAGSFDPDDREPFTVTGRIRTLSTGRRYIGECYVVKADGAAVCTLVDIVRCPL